MPNDFGFIEDKPTENFGFVPDEAATTTAVAEKPAPVKEGVIDSIKRSVNFEIGRQIAQGLTGGVQAKTLPQIFTERTGIPAGRAAVLSTIVPGYGAYATVKAAKAIKPKELWEKKFDPIIGAVPKAPVLGDETPVNTAVKSVLNLGASFADFAQSPLGAASAAVSAVGAIPKAIVEGLFTVDMLKNVITEGTKLWQNWDNLTTSQKIDGAINEVGAGAMAVMLGMNLKGKTLPKARQEARLMISSAHAKGMKKRLASKNLSNVQIPLPPASAPLQTQTPSPQVAAAAAQTAAPAAPAATRPTVTPGPTTGSSPSSLPAKAPTPQAPRVPSKTAAKAAPAPTKSKQFQKTMYQGRGATPAEVYGEEAVKAGRAIPILGEADYFANTEKDAGRYGKDITRHDVRLENPMVIDSTRAWRQLLTDAGTTVLDSRGREWYENPERIPGATRKLQAYLRSKGYDGVIIEIPENADMNAAGESIKGLRESFGHSQVVRFRRPGKGAKAVQPPKAAEAPTPAFQGPPPKSTTEQRAEFEKRYVDLAERTSAKEKESKPEDWTPEQKAAWDAGDWQKFSRLRGYTEAEIAEYKQFVDAYEEGRRIGYSEDELMELSNQGVERAKKAKAEQPPTVTPVPQPRRAEPLVETQTRKGIHFVRSDADLKSILETGFKPGPGMGQSISFYHEGQRPKDFGVGRRRAVIIEFDPSKGGSTKYEGSINSFDVKSIREATQEEIDSWGKPKPEPPKTVFNPEKGPFVVEWGTRSRGNKYETFDDFNEAVEFYKKKALDKNNDGAFLTDADGNEYIPDEAKPAKPEQPKAADLRPAATTTTRSGLPPQRVEAAVARAASSFWKSRVGTYRETSAGLPAGGATGKAIGGRYTEINNRKAAEKAERYKLMAERADRGELNPTEVAELRRQNKNLPPEMRVDPMKAAGVEPPKPGEGTPKLWSTPAKESDAVRMYRAQVERRSRMLEDLNSKLPNVVGKPTESAMRARIANLEKALAQAQANLAKAEAQSAKPKGVKPNAEVQGEETGQEVAGQPKPGAEPRPAKAGAAPQPETENAKPDVKAAGGVPPERQGQPAKPEAAQEAKARASRGKRKGRPEPEGEEEDVVLTREQEIGLEAKMKGAKKLLQEFEDDERNQKDFITWMHANGKRLRRRTSFPIRTDLPPKRVLKGKKWVLVDQRTMDVHYEDAPSRTEDLSNIWWEKQYYSSAEDALIHDAPDQLAKEAFEAGIIPDASVDTMWRALRESIDRRKRYIDDRMSGFDPNDPLSKKERKLVDFYESTGEQEGRARVQVDDMVVGDEFDVGGIKCRVKSYDPDTGDVVIEADSRFGEVTLPAGTVFHADAYRAMTPRDLLEDFLGQDADAESRRAVSGPLTPDEPPKPKTELLANSDMPFNLTGERIVTGEKPPTEPPPSSAGPVQPDLFTVEEGARVSDAVQAADVAERMYGGPQGAIDHISRQLEVLDRDPATSRTIDSEQRASIQETIDVLRSRLDLGKPASPEVGAAAGKQNLGPLFDFFDGLDKKASKILDDELGGVHDIAQLAMNVRAAAALVAKGAALMAKGVIRFSRWAPQFISQTSPKLQTLLGSIYNRAQQLFLSMRNRFSGGRGAAPVARMPVTPPPAAPQMAGALRNGRAFLGQVLEDSVAWALRGYSEWMVDRLRRVGGPISRQVANAANQIISHQRLLYGQLTPHLDLARRLAGKFNRGTQWLHGLDRITPYAAVARVVGAIEGTIPVPAWARQVVDAARTTNYEIGQLAQRAIPGFIASGLFQRNLTAYGMDLIRRGSGRQWMRWAEGIAAANRIPLQTVVTYLHALKRELDAPGLDIESVRKINQDFVRQFPAVVTHIRTMFGWEAVVHADLFSYLETAAQRTAHAVAFRQAFPNSRVFARVRAEAHAELPTDTQAGLFDALMRTLQGFPTDTISWMAPDNIIGMGVRMGLQTVNSIMGKLALTLQLGVQPGETLFGATPQFLGMANYMRAMARLKHLYPHLEQMGAVNRVMRDYTYDPNARLRSISRLSGNVISKFFGEDVLNELQEGAAAATAHVVVERIMTGRLSRWERRMLPQTFRAMGFTDGQVQTMMSASSPVAQRVRLLDQFQRRAASWLTSGNKQMAEGSRLGASRLFNSIFRFQSYPMMKANQLRRVFGNMQRAIETGNAGEIRAASEMAVRFMFGTALQGAVTTGLVTLFSQGPSGAKTLAAQVKDDTMNFVAESFLATIGGPIYLLTKLQRQTGLMGLFNGVANAAFPLSTMNELLQASWGLGPYSDMTPQDRLGEFIRRRVPGLRPVRMAMSAVGLSQENVALNSAMRAFYKWRADVWGRDTRESNRKLDERKVFRTHMKRAVKFLNNGEKEKFKEALRAAAKAGKTDDSVKRSLLGKRILKDIDGAQLTTERVLELRKRIGEDAFLQLLRHDAMLEEIADSL